MIRPRPEAERNCLECAAVWVRGDERGMGIPSPGRTPEDAAPLRHRRVRAFLGIVLIDLAMQHVFDTEPAGSIGQRTAQARSGSAF